MIQTVLLVTAIVFIALDAFLGFRRGFVPALIRLGVILLCAVASFFLAPVLSHLFVEIPLPFLGGETLGAFYEGYLHTHPELTSALELSEAVYQIVFHLPEVLLTELSFFLLFGILRFVTLIAFAVVTRTLFGRCRGGKRASAKEEEKPKKHFSRSFRSGGAIIGVLQAVVCLSVLFVPFFGFVEFGERFDAAFCESEYESVATIAADMQSKIIDPINQSPVTATSEKVGLRRACVWVFHRLSDTTIVLSNEARTIDYFEYLESLFPAVSALLMLSDVDPEHMTDSDYDNLCVVLQTAQQNEDISQTVKDSVTGVVTNYVDTSFRESADVFVNLFTKKIVDDKESITSEELKNEVKAIQNTLKVMQTATSESADSAFEVVGADVLVEDIIKTEKLYDTIVEVANDPEQCQVLRKDFVSTEDQKGTMKAEIEKYRNDSSTTRSPEDLAKILEITDALALILEIDLADIPAS